MALIQIMNMTENTLSIADTTREYLSIAGNQIRIVDDSLLEFAEVQTHIQNGNIKIFKGRKMIGPSGKKKGQKGPSKAELAVAHLAGLDMPENDPSVISQHKSEEIGLPKPGEAVNPAEGLTPEREEEMTDLGSKLVRSGRKKKLVPVSKSSKRISHLPAERGKKIPGVLEFKGSGGDMKAITKQGSDDGAKMIVESDFPGGAYEVNMDDAVWSELAKLSRKTDAVVDSIARERKSSLYAMMGNPKRMQFITATTDVEFLKELEGIEWEPTLNKAIKKRLVEVGATVNA